MTILFALRRKRSVPEDLFYAYWRDAHCQISSRLPGQYHLWTHRLDYDLGQAWPRIPGVERHLPEEDRFEGVPEPVFLTEADLKTFLPKMSPLMNDEYNLFEETIGYRALGDHSRVFVDRFADPAPVFDEGGLRLLVFCKQVESLSTDEFRSFMFDRLAATWSQAGEVLKLRMHLFEPHVNEDVLIGGERLSHYKAPEKQYQAAFEIVFDDALAMHRFATSGHWLADEQAAHMRAQHAFRVTRRCSQPARARRRRPARRLLGRGASRGSPLHESC